MSADRHQRRLSEGCVPVLDVEGTAFDCGMMLGYAWHEALVVEAQSRLPDTRPWWRQAAFGKLVSRYVPHLPDLYRGMAKAAGVEPDQLGSRPVCDATAGCTSFAVAPSATLDGHLICGQTKDTPEDRCYRYVVLRMKPSDGPAALTLTYRGAFFGHGFVAGGCSVFRNSLYAGAGTGRLPYDAWGLLALHCSTVEEVVDLTRQYGVSEGFHCTIADERGGIVGIENGRGGIAVLKPRDGIYTHANTCLSNNDLRRHETVEPDYLRTSQHREDRLRLRLEADQGRLTSQLSYAALCDHDGYPDSVCNHRSSNFGTTAVVIAEPARGLLRVSRGSPCRNWPRTYHL